MQHGNRSEIEGMGSPEQQLAAMLPVVARRKRGMDDPEFRRLLVGMCELAHARGWRAEQLILELKHLWGTAYGTPARRDAFADRALLNQAVSFCIEEFYRSK